ncbi:MAG TPA: HAMP domain-containing sensor histidine kinase [Gemmatimonadaceae bacterium]|jgi:signal transduction histidine kinase|nr:HAMP domain-containing sensor histidine kinase [Gemmatimonadaceae bacterium]
MTLRTRLGLGIVSITIILLVPLLLALRSLESVHQTTRSLRDREFAGSLQLGRFRKLTDDIKRGEDALAVIHDSASLARMHVNLAALASIGDSLNNYKLSAPGDMENAILSLRAATDAEYAAASSGNANVADEISAQRTRPALLTIDQLIAKTEAQLREETRDKAEKTANETVDAQRTAAGSLAIALLLATLIAIWLTRSISRPVHDLEKGMRAVADGDFTHRLPTETRKDEFGRLNESYQRMTSQLAELDKLKAEFVSVASHELKTPINVIVGYLELLQENIYGELNPKQREICATLGKQAQTLTRLVKRLLDISRFEAGGGKLERRQIDLDRFLHTFESSFQVLALQREISFRVVRGDDLPAHVLWDEDRINEVLGNLLSNAFKFTDRGGTVELAVEGQDNEVSITVRDSGAGIPPEQLPHIFEKFYQANNQAQSSSRGTGLGLAIAREIVEAHGGSISVASSMGVGTTFTITLPVRAVVTRRTPFRRTPVVEEVA